MWDRKEASIWIIIIIIGYSVRSSRMDRYVHFSGPIFVCEID